MKKLLLFIIILVSASLSELHAQESDQVGRNGQWIVELGNGASFSIAGPVSGGSIIFGGDNSLSTIGLNAGKFISDDFALKANLGLLSLSGGPSLYTIMGGGKYYISGKIPVEVGAGITGISSFTQFTYRGTIGYAISLADNINLEPVVGIISAGETNGLVGLAFALFF